MNPLDNCLDGPTSDRELSSQVSVDAEPLEPDVSAAEHKVSRFPVSAHHHSTEAVRPAEHKVSRSPVSDHHHSTEASSSSGLHNSQEASKPTAHNRLDALILCHDQDRNSAEKLSECLNTIKVREKYIVSAVFDATPGKTSFESLREQVDLSNYVLVYFTEDLCSSPKHVHKVYTCLEETLQKKEKHGRIVPVHTENIETRRYEVPYGTEIIIGIEFYGNLAPREIGRLEKMFETYSQYEVQTIQCTKKEDKTAEIEKKTSELKVCEVVLVSEPLEENYASGDFIDKKGSLQYISSPENVPAAESVCYIQTPEDGSATGFRVGSNYIMTAAHVVGPLRPDEQVPDTYCAVFGYCGQKDFLNLPKYEFKTVVYKETIFDVAVLELKDREIGKTHPPLMFNMDMTGTMKTVSFIGHSEGDRMQINRIGRFFSLKKSQKDSFISLNVASKNLTEKPYDSDDKLTNLFSEKHYLFHCLFSKGGSGSPGIIFKDQAEPVVQTMLTRGYPWWYYNEDYKAYRSHWKKQHCVEQGVNFCALFKEMKTTCPALYENISQNMRNLEGKQKNSFLKAILNWGSM